MEQMQIPLPPVKTRRRKVSKRQHRIIVFLRKHHAVATGRHSRGVRV
jgi:hypothetical protein